MLKRQKELLEHQLSEEEKTIAALEKHYRQALHSINEKIRLYQADEQTVSRVHHINFQKQLKRQIEAELDRLHAGEYTTIQQYLDDTYTNSYIGTMYDMAGQGVPVIAPIDKNAAVKAILTDSQISEDLYTTLGVDTKKLKQAIRSEITRGIASGMLYSDIARNVATVTGSPLNRAKTIVRTEGHRIQEASRHDARMAAKAKGAETVKQWESTLDGETRPTHRQLDGQIRDVDKPFTADGKEAMYPGDFGDPAEDCNCRCMALTRARKALMNPDELKRMQERAAFFELDKTQEFEEFKGKYLRAAETLKNQGESGIIKDATELSFDKQEKEALSRLANLENEIKRYDQALEKNARLQEDSFDIAEWARLGEEADAIVKKKSSASRMIDEVKNQIDNIKRDRAWYQYEKPFAKLQTVSEVEQAITNAGWFKGKVSLQGIPADTAKSVAASFKRVFDTYPQMIGKVKSLRTEALGATIWAGFSPMSQGISIGQAIYSADVKTLKKKYDQMVALGYFPKGTDYRSIFVHEMGHAIDFFLGKHKGTDRISYAMQWEYLVDVAGFKSAYGQKAMDYVEKHVSKYARTNQKELFAECFSEYVTSQHPRDMASWYGEQIETALEGWLE